MREIPAGWIGARTVSEAISVLANLKVTEVSLDHDIIAGVGRGSLYQALMQETYKGVAYYLATMPLDQRPKIRIHTANVGAAHSMCDILKVKFEDTYQHYSPENYKE